MATCSRCGMRISEDATFCSSCGSRISSVSDSELMQRRLEAGGRLPSNVAAMLSYLLGFITGFIFLSLEPYKKDPFVRFHAFQSTCYGVVVVIIWVIWNNLAWMGYLSLGVFWVFVRMMGALISVGIFLYWLFLMYKAYNKERYTIPIIGTFAANLAGKQG
jgi:uncharacterized membrane protein